MDPKQEATRNRRAKQLLVACALVGVLAFGIALGSDISALLFGTTSRKDVDALLLGHGFYRFSTAPGSSPFPSSPKSITLTQYSTSGAASERIELVQGESQQWLLMPDGHLANKPAADQMFKTLAAVRIDGLPLADSEQSATELGLAKGAPGTIQLELTPNRTDAEPLSLIVLGDLVRRADSPQVWRMAARHVLPPTELNWLAKSIQAMPHYNRDRVTKIQVNRPGDVMAWRLERSQIGELPHQGWELTHPGADSPSEARVASLLMYACELPVLGRMANSAVAERGLDLKDSGWKLQISDPKGLVSTVWVGPELVMDDQSGGGLRRTRRLPVAIGADATPVYLIGRTQAAELFPSLERLLGEVEPVDQYWPGRDPIQRPAPPIDDKPDTPVVPDGVEVIVLFARGTAFPGAGPSLRSVAEAAEAARAGLAELAAGAEFSALAERLSDWRHGPGGDPITDLRQHPMGQPPADVMAVLAQLAPGALYPEPVVAEDGVYLIRRRR